jgi:phospholipid/cholesterol/gamma-HCH transport system ATP-binding protein
LETVQASQARGAPPGSGGEARGPLILVDHLTKRFGDKVVLDDLSVAVERGETMVIIGGSGAGKSTLARHLIGLEKPTSGRVVVGGVDLARLHGQALVEARKRFGVVFQRGALLDSFNVFDNVAFPLREGTELDEAAIHERVMRYLAELGVEEAIDKVPSELSGGMLKRVGIARAMVIEPEILIYDEPTSGLDPITSRLVDQLIEQVRSSFLVTSVVITHDMATALDVSDRMALLARGKIVAQGSPEELLAAGNEEVELFLRSSGVDPDRLAARAGRKTPEQIRSEWAARRPQEGPGAPRAVPEQQEQQAPGAAEGSPGLAGIEPLPGA